MRTNNSTNVNKYKCHGNTQQSTAKGRKHLPSHTDECTLVQKAQIKPITTAKDLMKMLEEAGTKYLYLQ